MKYNVGTVSVTNGSNVVTGVGTLWTIYITPGQLFTINNSNVWYTVGSVINDTTIHLSANYAGTTASGQAYTITQSFTPHYSLPYPEPGDVQIGPILGRALNMLDTLLNNTNTLQIAASQAAMLALNVTKGAVCRRTDTSETYFLTTNSPSTLADWVLIS